MSIVRSLEGHTRGWSLFTDVYKYLVARKGTRTDRDKRTLGSRLLCRQNFKVTLQGESP